MAIQNKGKPMKSKGMVLYMNRNTRKTNGYYYVNVIKDEDKGKHQDNEKDIRLKWSIIKSFQLKEIKDENIKRNRKL